MVHMMKEQHMNTQMFYDIFTSTYPVSIRKDELTADELKLALTLLEGSHELNGFTACLYEDFELNASEYCERIFPTIMSAYTLDSQDDIEAIRNRFLDESFDIAEQMFDLQGNGELDGGVVGYVWDFDSLYTMASRAVQIFDKVRNIRR